MNQTQDKARMKRLRTEQAVQFAAQSRWEDAIAANRAILAAFPIGTRPALSAAGG